MDHLYRPRSLASLTLTTGVSRSFLLHLISDWFAPDSNEVDAEVSEMHRVLALGGMVFWRSAARRPWYNAVFERAGFRLQVLGMREGPEKAIDRVNMCVFGCSIIPVSSSDAEY